MDLVNSAPKMFAVAHCVIIAGVWVSTIEGLNIELKRHAGVGFVILSSVHSLNAGVLSKDCPPIVRRWNLGVTGKELGVVVCVGDGVVHNQGRRRDVELYRWKKTEKGLNSRSWGGFWTPVTVW